MIKEFLNRQTNFLSDRMQKIYFVLFTGIFAGLFLLVFEPYGMSRWNLDNEIPMWAFYCFFALTGMSIVSISQFIIRKIPKFRTLKTYQIIVWLLIETSICSLIFLLGFDLYNKHLPFLSEFFKAGFQIFAILFIPYGIFYLYQSTVENNIIPTVDDFVKFYDEYEKQKLSLAIDKILFLESADNYVEINYLSEDRIKSTMLRNTLKNIESQNLHPDIIRCHRSYMVNKRNILIVKSNKVKFKHELDIEIPVSRTYSKSFKEAI
jgi:hypothetical protein